MSAMRLLMITCLLTAGLAGCSENPATGESELIFIDREQEITIGNQAAPEFEQAFGGELDSSVVQQYVDRVGQELAETTERDMPYEFGVLRSDLPNAFALPGGKVYVTAGLLSVMESERELAAVLGHELGHVAARHNVKGLQRQVGVQLLAQLAAVALGEEGGQAAQMATEVVGGMINLRYTREQEYEADQLGLRYLTRANYSPWGMRELLETLAEEAGGGGGRMTEFFSTHPLTENRIERVTAMVQEQYAAPRPQAPADATFRRVRQIAREQAVPQEQIQEQLEQQRRQQQEERLQREQELRQRPAGPRRPPRRRPLPSS